MKEVVNQAKHLQNVNIAILFLNDYYVKFMNFSVYQK